MFLRVMIGFQFIDSRVRSLLIHIHSTPTQFKYFVTIQLYGAFHDQSLRHKRNMSVNLSCG